MLEKLASGAGSDELTRFSEGEVTGHFGVSTEQVDIAPMVERVTTWWQAAQH
ncbi:hypothetical protein [Actinoplanes sp. TFC3]|uniref:hypothetical protein n=1 Tax=Actinoplanes sp. TFC3 TaxID=1710355 RepID=UPI00137B4A84|nr:hypothetical protein [Actinoplanes sp. TFC3]